MSSCGVFLDEGMEWLLEEDCCAGQNALYQSMPDFFKKTCAVMCMFL